MIKKLTGGYQELLAAGTDAHPGAGEVTVMLGADRRVVLTHSVTRHDKQARGLDQTLTKAGARLDELAARASRQRPRSPASAATPGPGVPSAGN